MCHTGSEVWGFCTKLIRAVRSQKCVFLNRSLQSRTLLSKNCQHCSSFSFLWGYCFGLLVTFALGYKARVDSLACMPRCLCATDSTLVRHLLTSWWPAWQPSRFIHVHSSIGGAGSRVGRATGFRACDKTYTLPTELLRLASALPTLVQIGEGFTIGGESSYLELSERGPGLE